GLLGSCLLGGLLRGLLGRRLAHGLLRGLLRRGLLGRLLHRLLGGCLLGGLLGGCLLCSLLGGCLLRGLLRGRLLGGRLLHRLLGRGLAHGLLGGGLLGCRLRSLLRRFLRGRLLLRSFLRGHEMAPRQWSIGVYSPVPKRRGVRPRDQPPTPPVPERIHALPPACPPRRRSVSRAKKNPIRRRPTGLHAREGFAIADVWNPPGTEAPRPPF